MKKLAVVIVSACMLFSASSAAFANAPVMEKKHEQKMHAKKMHEKRMHEKRMHAKKMHTKSSSHKLHAKSLKAKDITQLPKTGYGGASEQSE